MPTSNDLPAEEVPEESPEEVDEDDLPGKIDYDSRSVGALAAAHEAENEEAIDLDDEDEPAGKSEPKSSKTPKGAKLSVPNFDRFRMMLGLSALAFIALIIFLFMAIFPLPKATITIKTSSEP